MERVGLLDWATTPVVDYDILAPGVIASLLSSGPARRQAVFALLACEPAANVCADRAAEGRAYVLLKGSTREILTAALSREPPTGLSGALERIGAKPLTSPALYRQLLEVYVDPKRRRVADALRYVGTITTTMLHAADVLPPVLIHPAVLKRIGSLSEARGFVASVEFAQSVNSRMTDEVLAYALQHMRDEADLDDLVWRFLRRADAQLGQPLPVDDEVHPLLTARDLIMASREFRNCLGTERKVCSALRGQAAYAVIGGEGVMEFTRLSTGGWLFMDVHGARNHGVEPELLKKARAKCVAGGVPFLRPRESQVGRYSRFVDPWDPCWLNVAA